MFDSRLLNKGQYASMEIRVSKIFEALFAVLNSKEVVQMVQIIVTVFVYWILLIILSVIAVKLLHDLKLERLSDWLANLPDDRPKTTTAIVASAFILITVLLGTVPLIAW